MIETPQLAWPLRTTTLPDGTTAFVEVEQDSRANVLGDCALLLELRVDQLPWAEDLGIPDPLGSVDPVDAAMEIEAAMRDVETRLPVSISVADGPGGRAVNFRVGVDGPASDHQDQDGIS